MFKLIAVLFFGTVFSLDADIYWGNWLGPANGTSCLAIGAPGGNLQLSKTLDLATTYGFSGLGSGILLRADNRTIYLKENRDYFAAPHILRGIDPFSGTTLWSSGKSALEDMSNPRGFQLFNDPRGHNSLHVPVYYEGYWNVFNLKNMTEEYLIYGSHACLGSRIIMGKWAWRNAQTTQTGGGMTWSHTGRLQYWNGTQYVNTTQDPIQLLDQAWENGRAVIFGLRGYAYPGAKNDADTNATKWESARFMVLDSSGVVISDTPVTDIQIPVSGCCCYFEGSMGGIADTADILMKLSVKGDYVYAIERSTFDQKQLVRRSISAGFKKIDSIILGTDPLLSNVSYSVSGDALFLQGTDTLTAYSLDLRTVKWKKAIPHRTLYHIFVQGLTRVMNNGLKNRNLHSLASDTGSVYSVSDSALIVFRANDGAELFRHKFTDLPAGGTAGSVILMPDYVVVSAAYISTKIWIFKNSIKNPIEISLSTASTSFEQFTTIPLRVIARNSDNSLVDVTSLCRFEISDTNIVKCTGDSLLFGKYPDSVKVIATHWGLYDTITVKVDSTTLLPDSLRHNRDTIMVMVNDSFCLSSIGWYHSGITKYSQSVNDIAVWNTSSSSSASVSNGVVKGLTKGTALITSSYKQQSDNTFVRIAPFVSYVKRINFGCVTSPVKDGWISVSTASFSSISGYGWTTANGGCRSDRRDNILLKSLVLSSSTAPSVWKMDVPDGEYFIRIAMGDNSYDTDATYSWTAIGSDTLIRHSGRTNTISDNPISIAGGTGLSLTVKGSINYIVLIANKGVALSEVADDFQSSDFPTGTKLYNLVVQDEETHLCAYPNPFNPSVNIRAGISKKHSNFSLKVYGVNGVFIEDLSRSVVRGRLVWTPTNRSSAVYVIRLVNGDEVINRMVYLLK